MGLDLQSVVPILGLGESDRVTIVSINIFVALLCACIVIGHLLEEIRWVNESTTALAMGLLTGSIILLTTGGKDSRILVFSEDLFFIYLLPPIIFNAGFQVKKKHFFRNFIAIVLYGAVGTIVSFVTISFGAMGLFSKLNIGQLEVADFLAIGAIFSATDSVCTLQVLNQDETPLLYSLVFGEGVVNDATSVVLFNAIRNFNSVNFDIGFLLSFVGNFFYLFTMSTLLGALTGLLSAYIIKTLYIGRHSTDREVSLMMLMAYLSYMLAELLDLSGILTVFFCGIVMSHYTWHNVTENSRITTKHSFATLSFITETFLFLYVGMDALDIEKWRLASSSPIKSITLSSVLLGLLMVGRAAFVFPLSFLLNMSKKAQREKIDIRKQVIIWWAGLMRGAVSIALAYNKFSKPGDTQQVNAIMITSTITIVLFSMVVFGMLTKPLLNLLVPRKPRLLATNSNISASLTQSILDPLLSSMLISDGDVTQPLSFRPNLQLLLTAPSRPVHHFWRKFDNKFMRPVFGGRGFVPIIPGSPVERSIHEEPQLLLDAVAEANGGDA